MKRTRPSSLRNLIRGACLLFGLAAVLGVAACGGSSSSSSGGGNGNANGNSASGGLSKAPTDTNATLIVNNAVPIATLDPNFTTNDQDPGFDGALYSTLTQVAHNPGPVAGTSEQNLGVSAVKPYVAQSWQWSDGMR